MLANQSWKSAQSFPSNLKPATSSLSVRWTFRSAAHTTNNDWQSWFNNTTTNPQSRGHNNSGFIHFFTRNASALRQTLAMGFSDPKCLAQRKPMQWVRIGRRLCLVMTLDWGGAGSSVCDVSRRKARRRSSGTFGVQHLYKKIVTGHVTVQVFVVQILLGLQADGPDLRQPQQQLAELVRLLRIVAHDVVQQRRVDLFLDALHQVEVLQVLDV